MSNHTDGELIAPAEKLSGDVVRVERAWHRHEHDLVVIKPPRYKAANVTLGVGGILLALAGAVAFQDLVAIPDSGVQKLAVPGAVKKDIVAATTLTHVVDAAPAKAVVGEKQVASLPFVPIPAKRPSEGQTKAEKIDKPDRAASVQRSDGVVFYDRCNPSCETKDPLVVGASPSVSQPGITTPDRSNQLVELGWSALRVAGRSLGSIAVLPLTTFELGRDVVAEASRTQSNDERQ